MCKIILKQSLNIINDKKLKMLIVRGNVVVINFKIVVGFRSIYTEMLCYRYQLKISSIFWSYLEAVSFWKTHVDYEFKIFSKTSNNLHENTASTNMKYCTPLALVFPGFHFRKVVRVFNSTFGGTFCVKMTLPNGKNLITNDTYFSLQSKFLGGVFLLRANFL